MEAPPPAGEVVARLRRLADDVLVAIDGAAVATRPNSIAALATVAETAGALVAAATAASAAEARFVLQEPPRPAVPLVARLVDLLERPRGTINLRQEFANSRRWSTIPLREERVPPPPVEQMRFESTEWCECIAILPNQCDISADGGTSKHKMVNQSDRKLEFSFHSSAHSNYSVDMIDGIIDVGESKEFVIKRKAGKPQPDELAIYYSDATGFDPLKHFVDQPMGEYVGETAIKLSAAE